MDSYLEHLINNIIESDNAGKLQKYYKNEVNREGIDRETKIYKWNLGPAKIDELKNIISTGKITEGKNDVTLATIRYEIRYNYRTGIELACIISKLKLIEKETGLNVYGTIEVFPNDKDLKISPITLVSHCGNTPEQSILDFFNTLDDLINSIADCNNEELRKYKEVIHELLD